MYEEHPKPFYRTVTFTPKCNSICTSPLAEDHRRTGSTKEGQVLLLFKIALFYLLEAYLNKYDYTFIVTNIINVI